MSCPICNPVTVLVPKGRKEERKEGRKEGREEASSLILAWCFLYLYFHIVVVGLERFDNMLFVKLLMMVVFNSQPFSLNSSGSTNK